MEATETLTELTARVATAVEAALIEHGPDAVNLALLAYQFDAIRYLAFGFIGLIATVAIILGYLKIWLLSEAFDADEKFASRLCAGLLGVFGAFFSLVVTSQLLSPAHWFAALGSPELLIATKALQAAGAL